MSLKTRLLRVESMAILVAIMALAFSIYQHFRIQEYERATKCPILAFDVVMSKRSDACTITLLNKGLTPATICETRVNGIIHSDVSLNEIRQTIFDTLKPILLDTCTIQDIVYAGFDEGSTVGASEKAILLSVARNRFRPELDSRRLLHYFDRNTMLIKYCDLRGSKKIELCYP